jgi:hypothetical protein
MEYLFPSVGQNGLGRVTGTFRSKDHSIYGSYSGVLFLDLGIGPDIFRCDLPPRELFLAPMLFGFQRARRSPVLGCRYPRQWTAQ